MILQAGYDCYLTQSADVPMSERKFENQVLVQNYEDVKRWKEITSKEKETMLAKAAFIDVEQIDVNSLDRVDSLLRDIAENINSADLTTEEALAKKDYFPAWKDLIGTEVDVSFRFCYDGTLYEVIQKHTPQEDWKPGTGTESLYKVVQIEHAGTLDDPIPWVHNMELEKGKYYTDKDVLYLCIRDSGIGMAFDLENLISGGYVQIVEEDSQTDGTIDAPISYSQGMALEQGKYYSQYGLTYLCIQSSGPLVYDLKDIPAIAQLIEK